MFEPVLKAIESLPAEKIDEAEQRADDPDFFQWDYARKQKRRNVGTTSWWTRLSSNGIERSKK